MQILLFLKHPSNEPKAIYFRFIVSSSFEEGLPPLIVELCLSFLVHIILDKVSFLVVFMNDIHSFPIPKSEVVSSSIHSVVEDDPGKSMKFSLHLLNMLGALLHLCHR